MSRNLRKQRSRPGLASARDDPDPGRPRETCRPPFLATDQEEQLSRLLATAESRTGECYAHLSPLPDRNSRATPFALRGDGRWCERDNCPYAFVFVVPLKNPKAMERSARRRLDRPGAHRYFVHLRLEQATVVDARPSGVITERSLRAQDATAIELLRAARDHGVDAILAEDLRGGTVLIVFSAAVDETVHVLDEAVHTLSEANRWIRETQEPAPSRRLWRSMSARSPWGRARSLWWELTIALFCFVVAPFVVPLVDRDVSVPFWAALLAVLACVAVSRQVSAYATDRATADLRAGIVTVAARLLVVERMARESRDIMRDTLGTLPVYDADDDDHEATADDLDDELGETSG